jgi:hypothetical protein
MRHTVTKSSYTLSKISSQACFKFDILIEINDEISHKIL